MHKINGYGNVGGAFVAEDLALMRPPTEITAAWLNAVQSEIVAIITAAGIDLDVENNAQLLQALTLLFVSQAELDQAIADLVGAAPAYLNVLDEFSAAINNDGNFANTVFNMIAQKADLTMIKSSAAIDLSGANIALSDDQANRPIIILTGSLTANRTLTFPAWAKHWGVINNCTGGYTVNCRISAENGSVTLKSGESDFLVGDGTNIKSYKSSQNATQTIWVPAGAMQTRTTNGAGASLIESATNKIMTRALDFDAATAEYAQFGVRMPKSWDKGTVNARIAWLSASAGNVVWGVQAVAISDDDALDSAFGVAQTVTDSVTATSDVMQSDSTAAITIGGVPAELDYVVFQVYRAAADAADTCTADARLLGVVINYQTTSVSDA